MTLFRPCIDLHEGRVKQIVGSSLPDDGPGPEQNLVAVEDAALFAHRYRTDGLSGGHLIQLGAANDHSPRRAPAPPPHAFQRWAGTRVDHAAC